MEKEVTLNKTPTPTKPKTPSTNPIPKSPAKTNSKNIKYKYIGKEKLSEILAKSIPKQLIPTKRIGEIFGYVFLAVLIIAALTFPYGGLIRGKADISLKIGIPFTFLDLNAANPEKIPIKFGGLIIDIIAYVIISYAIEVIINLATKNPLLLSEEEKKKYPKIYKDKKGPTIADQLTKKIMQKNHPSTNQPQPPRQTQTKPKKTIQMYNTTPKKSTNQNPTPTPNS